MLDLRRNLFKGLERKIGRFFAIFSITPNQWTWTSVLFAFVGLYFLLDQNLTSALVLFIAAGFLDFVDGAIARYRNVANNIGAYLDTIADRYVESILLLGMLFLPLPKILLPHFAWIFLILFGSIMTTYAKAAAKEKDLVNQELKGGLLSRGERIILLIISLILGISSFTWMVYFLIAIAIFSNFTALQRINYGIGQSLKGHN